MPGGHVGGDLGVVFGELRRIGVGLGLLLRLVLRLLRLIVGLGGLVLRLDSRKAIVFYSLLGGVIDASESRNLFRLLERFSQFATRTRLSPSHKELAQAGAAAMARYHSLKDFEQRGIRLLRTPRRL